VSPASRQPVRQGPAAVYREQLEVGAILEDARQAEVAQHLQDLWSRLDTRRPRQWLGRLRRPQPPVRGFYLWGGVGRGKTWLMDLFYESVATPRKQRVHFHRFMSRVHQGLKQHATVRDPLQAVAEQWSRSYDLLCFDEFFVADIADAMLLAGLLEALFERGVTLVATSNVRPSDLYRDGLQRARFLPAIDSIERHCEVFELAGDTDHRLRILERTEVFHSPLDQAAETGLTEAFERFAAGVSLRAELNVNGRSLHAVRRGDGVIWFCFDELCRQARSAIDYIEIARAFNTVLLSDVPRMSDQDTNAVRRFIHLVDEFYDRNVKLIISAAVPLEDLYQGDRLGFEFQRTCSRLIEMQTHEYLARAHRA